MPTSPRGKWFEGKSGTGVAPWFNIALSTVGLKALKKADSFFFPLTLHLNNAVDLLSTRL